MSTFGIAKDMAKLNENNLQKLRGGRSAYKRLVGLDDGTRTIYQFKEASEESLKAIRIKMAMDNARSKRRSVVIGTICSLLFIAILAAAFLL